MIYQEFQPGQLIERAQSLRSPGSGYLVHREGHLCTRTGTRCLLLERPPSVDGTRSALGHYNDGMDITIAATADTLGTTVHRVSRAINRLGIRLTEPKSLGHGRPARVIDEQDIERLRAKLGVTPRTSEHSREEMFVLAALAADTRGFESVRSLARAAGVSPTTAATAARRLEMQGLIIRRRGLARMSGRVVEANLLEANRDDPGWQRLEPLIAATLPPVAATGPEPTIVPRRFWHLFWNVSPATLRVDMNADFIAARLLLSNDQRAVAWAVANLPATAIEKTSTLRGLSEHTKEWLQGLGRSKRKV